jgi:hypothetical protein
MATNDLIQTASSSGGVPAASPAGGGRPVRRTAPSAGVPGLPLVAGAPRPDLFNERAGPDVSTGPGRDAYVTFEVDPETHDVRVSILDGSGRLVRMVPAESVRQMISAMARYAGAAG